MRSLFAAIVSVLCILPSVAMAREVKAGDQITLHFTLRLSEGRLVTTTRSSKPMTVTLGETALVPGLEEGILGMEEGESRTIVVPPEKGYGTHRKDKVLSVKRDSLPDQQLSPGMMLEGVDPETKKKVRTQVLQVKPDVVVLDFNHPMAGKELHFDVEVLSVGQPSAQS